MLTKLFLIHTETGRVANVCEGTSMPAAPDGYHWLQGDVNAPYNKGDTITEDAIIPHNPANDYAANRAANYPDIRDQLDAIYWWATENNWHIAGFTDVVGQVKNTFPKPGGEYDGPPQDNTPVN